MPIKAARGYKKRCDQLASTLTRSLGYCLKCGSREWLQTSHIISRRYSATRTDLDNLQCLCAKCHRRLTDFPREFSHWISDSIGSDKYEELRWKAESYEGKFDWESEYARLKAL